MEFDVANFGLAANERRASENIVGTIFLRVSFKSAHYICSDCDKKFTLKYDIYLSFMSNSLF
jgi:transposase-like protein